MQVLINERIREFPEKAVSGHVVLVSFLQTV